MHPVTFPLVIRAGRVKRRFAPEDAFVTGSVDGVHVPCLSAPLQVALHEGYEVSETDLEDVARLVAVE